MHSFATAAATAESTSRADRLEPASPIATASSSSSRSSRACSPTAPRCHSLPDAHLLGDTHLYAAPGHGDTLRRARDSGVVDALAARGVEHVLVSNVDNLGATLDPAVLGAHLDAVDAGAAMSVEVVLREPGDAGGCVAAVAGKPVILEAFRLPPGTDLADFPHFNTNTLWISLAALRDPQPLTWFPVRRALEWPDGSTRDVVQFEQLIGQLSEFVPTAYIKVDRDRFLPIKTREDLAAAAPRLAELARAAGLQL
jgi:UTP--glucose-1-phosphate uridylyltransferase